MRLNLLDKNIVNRLTIALSLVFLLIGILLITLSLSQLPKNSESFDLDRVVKQGSKQFALKDKVVNIYNKFREVGKDNVIQDSDKASFFGFIDEVKNTKPKGDFLFLVLFQNDLELRPTGGYIGSYGILEIKNFEFNSIQVFDTVNLDSSSNFGETSPPAIQEYLKVVKLQMRDSNWDPNFEKSAAKALYFYKNESGDNRDFDGVVGINTKILEELVELLQPFVPIKAGGKNFSFENIVLEIEKEVEINYLERNLPRSERKEILNVLANYIIKNLDQLTKEGRIKEDILFELLYTNLKRKNILLFFSQPELERKFEFLKLAYNYGVESEGDYNFGIIDANMNSLKSNFFVKRASEYVFDMVNNLLTLRLKYTNVAFQRSWFNRDYLSYTRIFLPPTFKLIDTTLSRDISISFEGYNEFFQSLGFSVFVPLKSTTELEFVFEFTENNFLLNGDRINIIKQPGLHNENVTVKVIYPKYKQLSDVKFRNKGNLYFPEPGTVSLNFILEIDESINLIFD